MPIYQFEDGSQTFIPDTNPETIEKVKKDYELSKKGQASVLGDIGTQAVRGFQKIGEGLLTTAATPVDLFFDTDLTQSIVDHYKKVDVGEAKTTAGEVTRYLVQFGLPGFGTAGALSKFGKLGKFKSAIGAGVVDGAVATDDVVTLQDTFLNTNSESDEQRLARLNGSEAAYERLKNKMQVGLEGGAIVFGAPLALKLAGKVGGAALDTVTPAASYIAKTLAPKNFKQISDQVDEDQTKILFNIFKPENFRFFGESPDKLVGQTKYMRLGMVNAVQNQVDNTFNGITNVISKAVNSGTISQDTALRLTRSIEDYMFPKIRIDFQNPGADKAVKQAEAKKIQEEAFESIKKIENDYIDYKSVGLDYETNSISNLLQNNKSIIEDFSQKILDYSDANSKSFMNLFLPDELRDEIAENMGMYGTRLYRRYLDNAQINPELKESAIKELQEQLTIGSKEAESVFNELAVPGPKNKVSSTIETPRLLEEGLRMEKGILKGKTLTNLPATRRALGEVAGYLSGDWQKAIKNTQLVASLTAKKQANLVGKQEMFKNIKTLDEVAEQTGGAKFLKTEQELLQQARKSEDGTFRIFDSEGRPTTYRKFKAEDAGALDGMYATEKTYNALLGASSDLAANSDIISKAYASLLGVKAAAQYGKTVLSGGAQVRNFTSIPFFSLLNGNLGSTGRFIDSVSTSFAGLLDPKTRLLKKDIIEELTEQGMLQKGGAQLGETLEFARLASDNSEWVKGVFKIRDSAPVKFAEKAYGMTDNAGRVYNYLNEKTRFRNALAKNLDGEVPIDSAKNIIEFKDLIKSSRGSAAIKPRDIINNYGEEALERFIRNEAGEITANTVQNYQRIVPIVKDVIRRLPLGNFVAFPSEIIRNTYNALGRGVKELTSNNSEMQKIGMRRLTGAVATTSAIPVGLQSLGQLLTGVSKDAIDAYKRSFAAPWDRTATLVPIASDKNGTPTQFFNFSYMNPYDYLARPMTRVIQEYENGVRDEESLSKIALDAFGNATLEMFQSFAEPAFSAQAVFEAVSGKTSTGRKVWNEGDTLGDQTAKGFYHVINTLLPTATPFDVAFDPTAKNAIGLGIKSKNFGRAIIGSTNGKGEDKILDSRGNKIDVAETLVQAFSGIKVVRPQIERTIKYRAFEAQRAIRDTTNEFNSILRSTDSTSAQRVLQGYINENEDRFLALRDLYTAIEDARKLGLSDSQIEQQLKSARVANYKDVMRGIFKPIEANVDLVSASRSGIQQPVLDLSGIEMFQDLTGQFITPQRRKEMTRAAQILREEEEDKLIGT